MHVTLNYGREGLPLELPDNWQVAVVSKKAMPVLAEPEKETAKAYANPVECAPLSDLAKGKKSACILICDITRPVPNALLLDPMLKILLESGVPREGITILVATGLHRPNEGEELIRVVGSREIVENFRVENHFATRKEDHTFFANTASGTPVGVDSRFVNAELKMVVGLVEPHFMAGFSGGRKVIAPGVCHESTIRTFHNAFIMGDEKSCNLNMEGNPLHREQLDIVGKLAPVYCVNVVLDEERRISFVNFGELTASHRLAVDYTRDFFVVPVKGKYKTIITSCAGYPLDLTYYQTVKGMVAAKDALAPGGRIFIASECAEGFGSAHFRTAQEILVKKGWQGFLDEIRTRDRAEIDEWQTQKLTEVLAMGSVMLYAPRLSDPDHALTGVERIDDLPTALAEWIKACGDERVLVIPEGPYVIPLAE